MKKNEMTICLWFDDQAEEAARFYTSIFPDSEIGRISRFGNEGFEFHGKPEGSIMTVDFSLNGMKFVALNGGPVFKFNESISIMVHCETQEEIDRLWSELTSGGEESQCGWLKDKYGVSWQIVPSFLQNYFNENDPVKRARMDKAMFQMKKLDVNALMQAYNG